jgi:hypothetical protein
MSRPRACRTLWRIARIPEIARGWGASRGDVAEGTERGGIGGTCFSSNPLLPVASFRGDATIRSLSERSGHSASRADRTGFMRTRPRTPAGQLALIRKVVFPYQFGLAAWIRYAAASKRKTGLIVIDFPVFEGELGRVRSYGKDCCKKAEAHPLQAYCCSRYQTEYGSE